MLQNIKKDEYCFEQMKEHKRNSDGEMEFLVKWQGYEDCYNSWENYKDFADPQNNELVAYISDHNINTKVIKTKGGCIV